MNTFYKTLMVCCMFLETSDPSNAMIDSYSFEEGGPMRSIFPPKSVRDFNAQVLEPLGRERTESIRFLRLGIGIRDDDIPEIVEMAQTNLPNLNILDLSDGNVTVRGMKELIPLLLLPSLTAIYPSHNFAMSGDIPEITTALGEQGITGFNQRPYIMKINSKPLGGPKFYGKTSRNPKGKPVWLEGR